MLPRMSAVPSKPLDGSDALLVIDVQQDFLPGVKVSAASRVLRSSRSATACARPSRFHVPSVRRSPTRRATTTTGAGRTIQAIPIEPLKQLLAKYGR